MKKLCDRTSEFVEKHQKKILVAEALIIGGFLIRPHVVSEIASYRQLQQDAAEAKVILIELAYTIDALVSATVEDTTGTTS